jgi:phosphoglycerate dehydrogenase-like enzyme
MKAVFMTNGIANLEKVYGGGRRDTINNLCDVYPTVVTGKNFAEHVEALKDVQVIFSTWGMPQLTEEQTAQMPNLKAVFYGAGSVQGFARPFLASGIKVFSAWAANAIPVAEFTVACIILGMKQAYPSLANRMIEGGPRERPAVIGLFDTTVGIISLGMIGRKVCELLQPFQVDIVAYDPFVSDEVFAACKATRVELDDVFRQSEVVSLHAPNLESTKNMITGDHFRLMKTDATFINTARGAIIDQDQMIDALRERPDVNAHLDVVTRDPDFKLLDLPNAHFTPHVAGSMGQECWRMGDFMIEEFKLWRDGKPANYEVSEAMLDTMA